jgi:Domain of unknown function (DUF222)
VWLAVTWEGMVAVEGLLEPEAGQLLAAALEPLARPTGAHHPRSGGQRRADALAELARRSLEGGRLPQVGAKLLRSRWIKDLSVRRMSDPAPTPTPTPPRSIRLPQRPGGGWLGA